MKIQLLKIIAAVALLGVASGCASRVIGLSPRVPIHSKTDSMQIEDVRTPTTKRKEAMLEGRVFVPAKMFPHTVPAGSIIGGTGDVCFFYESAEPIQAVIGGIVANRWPEARVVITDLRSTLTPGLWTADSIAYIAASVTAGGGTVHFKASGKNSFASINEENFEIAYERALENFARQINAAPADLSRVVQ